MFNHQPTQLLQTLLSLESNMASNEALLADLIPSFESGETKLRREELHTALVIFCAELSAQESRRQELTQLLKREELESDLITEKLAHEKRIQDVKEMEKRDYTPSNEQALSTLQKVQQAIEKLAAKIQILNNFIIALTALEESTQLSIDSKLKEIAQSYTKLASVAQSGQPILIKYSPDFTMKQEEVMEINLGDIFNRFAEIIPEKLKTKTILPQQIERYQRSITDQFIINQFEQHIQSTHPSISEARIAELINSSSFTTAKEAINQHIATFMEGNNSIQQKLNTDIKLLAADQVQLDQSKAAKEIAKIMKRELEQEKSILQQPHLPKSQSILSSLAAQPIADKSHQVTEKLIRMIDSIKQTRYKMEQIGKTKISKPAANEAKVAEKEQASDKPLFNSRRLGG